MKKLLLCLLFLASGFVGSSQKVYFIYLQTESEQPFFVRLNDKIHSSTATGYLILSKLHDSTYNFSVGFPQNKWPDQNFSVTIAKKDHGYLLKNFSDKGWGLFDMQTLAVQMASVSNAKTDKPENKDVSPFTEILSKAADDPSLKEKPVPEKTEEKKPEEVVLVKEKKEEPKEVVKEKVIVKPVEAVDNPVVKKEEPKEVVTEKIIDKPVEAVVITEVKKEEIKEPVVVPVEEIKNPPVEIYKPSQVKKWSESSTTGGFGLVFIDDYQNGNIDTIRLIIPNPKPVEVPVALKEEPKEEKKFIEIANADTVKKEEGKLVEVRPVIPEPPVAKITVSNKCSETAAEADFFKLRKQMAASENDEDMLNEAKKYFKIKCFTTSQLKNLSTLFLNDEGKYKFFDTAYSYVTDTENFSSLQAELKEEYYINRFRAMLRN
ncbi:MAG: DUF4476 domain-containing protein [Chitinophagaceae bacterium]|nr:DUF4476 domain-containing protein [Chitinophagaceae bacterium]MBK9570621.1 DUF4476 domain-containing protein [Chitinophagaceae bacterium]MBL0272095.1 DUF4476 domain-containing protein [Chitinophagaceae bacterium]